MVTFSSLLAADVRVVRSGNHWVTRNTCRGKRSNKGWAPVHLTSAFNVRATISATERLEASAVRG